MMIELKVEGATCQHCVASIEKAVNQVTGVSEAKFDLATKTLQVEGNAEAPAIVSAVEASGFDVLVD